MITNRTENKNQLAIKIIRNQNNVMCIHRTTQNIYICHAGHKTLNQIKNQKSSSEA